MAKTLNDALVAVQQDASSIEVVEPLRLSIAQLVRQSLQQAYDVLMEYPDSEPINAYYKGLDSDDEDFKAAALTILRAVYAEPEYPIFEEKTIAWVIQQGAYKIRDIDVRENLMREIEAMSENGKIALYLSNRIDCDGVHMEDQIELVDSNAHAYLKACDFIHRNSDGRYNLSIVKPSSVINVIKSQDGDEDSAEDAQTEAESYAAERP